MAGSTTAEELGLAPPGGEDANVVEVRGMLPGSSSVAGLAAEEVGCGEHTDEEDEKLAGMADAACERDAHESTDRGGSVKADWKVGFDGKR